jgi:hypothetical protein
MLSTHFTVLWLFSAMYDLIHTKLHAIIIGTLLDYLCTSPPSAILPP